ncbi:hypothetical protein SRABI106_02314 [Rahnella aquatilis]|nr:hypothetical protein SRABI106_02314 [Rahnella aquatilis]
MFFTDIPFTVIKTQCLTVHLQAAGNRRIRRLLITVTLVINADGGFPFRPGFTGDFHYQFLPVLRITRDAVIQVVTADLPVVINSLQRLSLGAKSQHGGQQA